ncbi:MAG: acyl-CoA thioesterase [Spartobacteria bacterium]|nr:acyl-CoA thioesterase [Spartobacteria bacterium]
MSARRKNQTFKREPDAPASLKLTLSRRVNFREVDSMWIVWHGHYIAFFEEIATELRRRCGLSYQRFVEERLAVPIVQCHLDYRHPLLLDEEFTICAELLWTDAARINIEYTIYKADGSIAATGYTVQLFVDAQTNQPFYVPPPLFEETRQRWLAGEYKDMQ